MPPKNNNGGKRHAKTCWREIKLSTHVTMTRRAFLVRKWVGLWRTRCGLARDRPLQSPGLTPQLHLYFISPQLPFPRRHFFTYP